MTLEELKLGFVVLLCFCVYLFFKVVSHLILKIESLVDLLVEEAVSCHVLCFLVEDLNGRY